MINDYTFSLVLVSCMYIMYTFTKSLPVVIVCLDFSKCKCKIHNNINEIISWYKQITQLIIYTGHVSHIDKLMLERKKVYIQTSDQYPVLIICNPHARPTVSVIRNALNYNYAIVYVKSVKKEDFGIKIIRENQPLIEYQHQNLLPLSY